MSVTPGGHVTGFQLDVSQAAGHVRIKVYDSVGGQPKNLLGESGSLSVSGTGVQTFPVTATIPAGNTTIYAGFETDVNTLGLFDGTGSSGNQVHAYGTGPNPTTATIAGPQRTPWNALIYTVSESDIRAKIYSGSDNLHATLLGESGSRALTTGVNTIPVTAIIPSNGTVWVMFETNNTNLGLWTSTVSNALGFTSHTYGSGPNPISGTTQAGRSPYLFVDYALPTLTLTPTSGEVGSTVTAKGNLFAPAHTITFKWSGSTLTTAPTPVTSNSTGGFSGVTFTVPLSAAGSHIVNASDTTGNFTTASFTVDTAHLTVSPNSGTSGSLITLSGTGFGVSTPMSFTFNGVPLSIFPATSTNSSGGFSGAIAIVPTVSSGSYIINATSGLGVSATTPFTVGASAPSLYVTDLHYTALTNSTVNLSWSFPSLGGLSFSGFQINYTTPFGTPNTIIINNSHSTTTNFALSGLTANTNYSFRIGTVLTNGTVYAKYSNILSLTTIANTSTSPPNTTIGSINLNVGTNPMKQPFNFYRQNINTTALDLFVSYPNTYNTTCNFNYEFANKNQSYFNLATTANGTGRVKATFLFLNLGNEIVNTLCRDVITNDTGRYTITNSIDSIPLVQQVHNFENGVYGTQGQFGAFDLVELGVIIISMIALNRISEPVGAIIMIIIIGALAYFHIGSFYVTIFSAIAMVVLLVVSTSKKLAYTP